jgi:hypothetical protein
LSAQKREKSLAENYEKMSAETGEQPSTSYKLSAETGKKVRRKLVKIVEGCLSKMAKRLLKRSRIERSCLPKTVNEQEGKD